MKYLKLFEEEEKYYYTLDFIEGEDGDLSQIQKEAIYHYKYFKRKGIDFKCYYSVKDDTPGSYYSGDEIFFILENYVELPPTYKSLTGVSKDDMVSMDEMEKYRVPNDDLVLYLKALKYNL